MHVINNCYAWCQCFLWCQGFLAMQLSSVNNCCGKWCQWLLWCQWFLWCMRMFSLVPMFSMGPMFVWCQCFLFYQCFIKLWCQGFLYTTNDLAASAVNSICRAHWTASTVNSFCCKQLLSWTAFAINRFCREQLVQSTVSDVNSFFILFILFKTLFSFHITDRINKMIKAKH